MRDELHRRFDDGRPPRFEPVIGGRLPGDLRLLAYAVAMVLVVAVCVVLAQ